MIYEEQNRGGSLLDVLEDPEAGTRLAVNRLGAELTSLAKRHPSGQWIGFLYRDGETSPPSSGWANHATVMGYYLHRLWKEQSLYRGHLIRGGNHGFLRHFVFEAPEKTSRGLTYRVPPDRIPPESYPLKVALALSYEWQDGALRITFEFTNEEPDQDAHVSFGLHPGFAVSSIASARLLLPAGTYLRYMAPGNFLDGRVEEIPFAGGEMPFPKDSLPGSYLLGLGRLKDRIFHVEDPPGGRRVSLDFSEVPFATLWSDSDAFLCVEPCWGLPDSNPPLPFEQKIGIQIVRPGAILRRSFTMKPSFLP